MERIARRARQVLGRPASRRAGCDWSAVEAVKIACGEAGMTLMLSAWVPPPPSSLRSLVAAYCARYQEAYGLGAAPGRAPVAEAQVLASWLAVAGR